MESYVLGSECGRLLNLDVVIKDVIKIKDIPSLSWVNLGRRTDRLLPTFRHLKSSIIVYIALALVVISSATAVSPELNGGLSAVDPLQDVLHDRWEYRRLARQIGWQQTRTVAGMIEFSEYPEFIRSIISVESSWNTEARSYKDAIGLMQVRLIAARDIDPVITEHELYDPVTNVRIGIEIFEKHMEYFFTYDKTEHWALTSYNRGRYGTFALNRNPPMTEYSQKVLSLTANM